MNKIEKFLLKMSGNILIGISYLIALYPVWSLILDQSVSGIYAVLNLFICYVIAFTGANIKSDESFLIFFKIKPILEILWGIGLFIYLIYLKGFIEVVLYTILSIICWYTVKWIIKQGFEAFLYHIENNTKQLIKEDSEIKRHLYLTIEKHIKDSTHLYKMVKRISFSCIKEHENNKRGLDYTRDDQK